MRTHILVALLLIAVTGSAQNVGIGETSPVSRLDIRAAAANNPLLRFRSFSGENVFDIRSSDNLHASYLGGNAFGTVAALTISNRFFGTFSSPQLRLNAMNNTGGGSESRLMFTNENDVGNDYSITTYTGSDAAFHRFSLSHRVGAVINTLLNFDDEGKLGIGINASSGKVNIGYNSLTNTPTLNLIETEDDFARINFTNQGTSSFWAIAGRNSLTSGNRRLNFYNSLYGDVMSLTAAGDVGIGTTSPTSKLHVTGDVDLTGALKVDGNAGTAGQVLTSNGSGSPTWQTMALANNTRFAITFQRNLSSITGDAAILNTRYNLNTSDVSIGAATITINRSGLYHFDLQVGSSINFASAPSVYPRFSILLYTGAPNPYDLVDSRIMQSTSSANTSYIIDDKTSLEVYITAPATLRINHSINNASGNTGFNISGYFAGHLISE